MEHSGLAEGRETLFIDTSQNVELRNVDEIPQWVAHWNKNMTEFVSERVARSGIYPSQQQMKAEDKQEPMEWDARHSETNKNTFYERLIFSRISTLIS